MSWLNNLRLRNKLILILILPLVAMIYFTAFEGVRAYSHFVEVKSFEHIQEVEISMTDVVTEMQKERALAYLLSVHQAKPTPNELARLKQQYAATDEAISGYDKIVANFDRAEASTRFNNLLDQIDQEVHHLDEVRAAVVAHTISASDAKKVYTTAIKNMLQTISTVAKDSHDVEISLSLMARFNISKAKEAATQLKSLLGNIFELHKIDLKAHDKVLHLQDEVNIYLEEAKLFAPEQEVKYITSVLNSENGAISKRLVAAALDPDHSKMEKISADRWFTVQTAYVNDFINLEKQIDNVILEIEHHLEAQAIFELVKLSIIASVALILSILLAIIVVRSILKGVRSAAVFADAIAQGDLDAEIQSQGKDEVGELVVTLVSMRDDLKERIESDAQVSREAMRVKLSLDNANQMTMIADKDYNVVYFNAKLASFFQEYGMAIKQDVPGFDKDKVMGSNIDVFHKNPSHQKGVLDNLTSTKQVELNLAGLTLELQVTPVVDTEGERIGTVVCWEDVTSQRQAEKELDEVVGAAANGDLTKQMNVDAYEGAIAQIGKGLNQVISVNRNVIEELNEVFGRLVEGDLTRSVTGEYAGTFHELKTNANNTISKLKEVMGSIADSSETVGNAANEIALGNADLSQRTEEQASSLEETSATMTDLSQRTKDGVKQMTEAATMADDTKLKAEEGGEVVGRVVEAMNEIQTSSKKINDIIGVIDEIAFQTNLLALNAAVEAARAGEQGRGFAVVAAEVRTLAQRSATAAKEIKDLIGDSVGKVDDGARLVSESGEALQAIIENVEGVAKVITELSESSRQQAASIGEVNESVSQMDTMTQQNAALVEESYAASNLMQEQAKSLTAEVGFFKVGHGGSTSSQPTAQATVSKPKPSAAPSQSSAPSSAKSSNKPSTGDDDEWEAF